MISSPEQSQSRRSHSGSARTLPNGGNGLYREAACKDMRAHQYACGALTNRVIEEKRR